MINKEKKIIFIHVPRTGGTSVKNALEFGRATRKNGYHKPWYKIKEAYPKKWDEYFKFSIVRNPWDRVYSIYAYYRYGNRRDTKFNPRKIPKTFEDFVFNLSDNLAAIGLKYTQAEFIGGEMDYIIRFEHLIDDFINMCEAANIEWTAFPHLRESRRDGDYRDHYADWMIDVVQFHFLADIIRYDYTFNGE